MGVWIETASIAANASVQESHPAWVCGLKLLLLLLLSVSYRHTLRGCVDWNNYSQLYFLEPRVTPCVGVWIETYSEHIANVQKGHTLRGCVDWNSLWTMISLTCVASHPAWVCGLKLINIHITMSVHLSHPAWVCGLKLHRIGNPYLFLLSHPAWVCGLKHVQRDSRK